MTSPYSGMTAVLYARVSTDDKGQNTDVQVLKMKEWCSHNEVEILGIYQEERSGKNMDRPELDRVIGRIARGGVNMLLAFDVSRLGRNASDVDQIRKTVSQYKTVIRYVTNDFAPETGTGRLINGVEAWEAEAHLEKHSNAVKAGMQHARVYGTASGKPIGRPPAIVIENGSQSRAAFADEKGRNVFDIDRAMELADSGHTISSASKILKVPASTMTDILMRLGRREEFENRRLSCPITTEQLMAMAREGMNMMECSAALHCSVMTIREKLIADGKLSAFSKACRAVRRSRKRMPTETSRDLYIGAGGEGGVGP